MLKFVAPGCVTKVLNSISIISTFLNYKLQKDPENLILILFLKEEL